MQLIFILPRNYVCNTLEVVVSCNDCNLRAVCFNVFVIGKKQNSIASYNSIISMRGTKNVRIKHKIIEPHYIRCCSQARGFQISSLMCFSFLGNTRTNEKTYLHELFCIVPFKEFSLHNCLIASHPPQNHNPSNDHLIYVTFHFTGRTGTARENGECISCL